MTITGILSLTNACKKIFRTDHLTQRRYKMCTQMCRLTLCIYLLKRNEMSCLLKSNNKNLEILSTYFIFIKTVFFQLDKFFKEQLAPSELSFTRNGRIYGRVDKVFTDMTSCIALMYFLYLLFILV